MWQQVYIPLADSLALSALAAALPVFVLLLLIGVLRKPAWVAGLSGLLAALVVALLVYGMPLIPAVGAITMGAAFGLFPIGWIVYWAIVLYRITQETGNFEIIKDSIGGLTADRRLQALLIAFALSAFIEGAAGFGTPVAVAAAMLAGLGFSPFFAAGICLLANTVPVTFGSIGIPVVTLAGITGIPETELSFWVGLLCLPVALLLPAYLMMVMGGWRGLRGVIPAVLVAGVSFGAMQFLVAAYVGPQLVDISAALVTIICLVGLLKIWQPKDSFVMAGEGHATISLQKHSGGRTLLAWSPYIYLVIFVLLWGSGLLGDLLTSVTALIEWPGLHGAIQRGAPVASSPEIYSAIYTLNWLAAAGTACAFASIAAAITLKVSLVGYFRLLWAVLQQLAYTLLTIASVQIGRAHV